MLAGKRNSKKVDTEIEIIDKKFQPYTPHFTDVGKDLFIIDDIAFITLKEPLEFKPKKIQRICLPSKDFEPNPNSTCYVSGWGARKFRGK